MKRSRCLWGEPRSASYLGGSTLRGRARTLRVEVAVAWEAAEDAGLGACGRVSASMLDDAPSSHCGMPVRVWPALRVAAANTQSAVKVYMVV
jgi:hypothetical protein